MTAVKVLALVAAGAVAAIFANFALLGVARGDEPVGKLSPRVFLAPAAPAVDTAGATAPAATAPAADDRVTTDDRATTEQQATTGATTSRKPGDDQGGHSGRGGGDERDD
jgi:hypothetical protein